MCFRICSIAGAPALLEDARAAAEIMCSPFFCDHVISTPFDGCLPGETCENCLCMTEKTRKLLKDRFDTLSIPNCVIKKGPTHGARHGNTEEQRTHHVVYNTYKRCRKKKKRWCIRSLSEQSKVQSSTSGTWVDRRVVCKTRRICAGLPFIHAHSSTQTPRINLDSSSQ